MTVAAQVRIWHDEEGWGVLDSAETPGGCFVAWPHIDHDGYRTLRDVTEVLLDWEAAPQDGYSYCAVRVRIPGRGPATPPSAPFDDAHPSAVTVEGDESPDAPRIAG